MHEGLRCAGAHPKMVSTAITEIRYAGEIRRAQRMDLFAVLAAAVVAAILVYFFDTGSLADWIAKHKETKVDEAIAAVLIFAVGMAVFSVRRGLELTKQLA